jgi:hypothetical protein
MPKDSTNPTGGRVSGNTSRTKALVSCCVVMVGTKWYHRDEKGKKGKKEKHQRQ